MFAGMRGYTVVGAIALAVAASAGGAGAALADGCANGVAREATKSQMLPDCRAYEMVTPVDKHGNEAGVDIASAFGGIPRPEYSYARADGEALFFGSTREVINGALGEAEGGTNYFWVASRGPGGWGTRAAVPPGKRERANQKENNAQLDNPEPIMPSSNLDAFALITQDSFGPAPLATPQGLYLTRSNGTADWLSAPTVPNPRGPLFESFGSTELLSGASPDLHTVYFAYPGTLVAEDELKDPGVENLSRAEVVASEASPDVGFYEWHDGQLRSAAVLPDGNVDPYGAVPAATEQHNGKAALPSEYANNQISNNGNNALFVSPYPSAAAPTSDPPELYLREHTASGGTRSVLVSKSEITGLPAQPAPYDVGYPAPEISGNGRSYAYSSPDGTRVFFNDAARLTLAAPEDESGKVYEYDSVTETLTYLPGVASTISPEAQQDGSPVLSSSADGSRFLFERRTPEGAELALWDGHVSTITQLPHTEAESMVIAPVRANQDGTTYVFQTNSPLPGFNNSGPFEQVYRYDSTAGTVTCLSCPPPGLTPTGSAHMSNSVNQASVLDSRGVANETERVFFDTPDPLDPRDSDRKRDVYEWENGSVSLISGGAGPGDSFLLDNGQTGRDIFFATLQPLIEGDTDGGYDIYDAREGGGFVPAPTSAPCASGCTETTSTPPIALGGTPTSSTFVGEGNLTPAPPPSKKGTPSRAQRLSAALHACKKRPRAKRPACVRQARHRFGAKRVAKKSGRRTK